MFNVAVLVNENEVAHSSFADTLSILERPLALGDQKREYYRFIVFDKYNIAELFEKSGEKNLLRFDSLFIATNATNNHEILDALCIHKDIIEEFILNGHGIFISSQKKLSLKKGENCRSISFLPEKYDYCIYDRPEKSSSDGYITILDPNDLLLRYPSVITEEGIDYRCNNNNFKPHKYRSHIIPLNSAQYTPLMVDVNENDIPEELFDSPEKHRKLLLKAGNLAERVIITSIAVDWAGHDELIENILVYITEGVCQFAFVRTSAASTRSVIDSYIMRARVAKISFREYTNMSMKQLLQMPHSIYVFSPEYEEREVYEFWRNLLSIGGMQVSIYHLIDASLDAKELKLHQYTSGTSVDQIKIEVANWLSRMFFPLLWGKSIWTYNYALLMMNDLNISAVSYLPHIFEELSGHFSQKGMIVGSYDNVINATCKMLEILAAVYLEMDLKGIAIYDEFPCSVLFEKTVDWVSSKLDDERSCSNQDMVYILVALFRIGYVKEQEENAQKSICVKTMHVVESYSTYNFFNCNNIILCQLIYLVTKLCEHNALPQKVAKEKIDSMLIFLKGKQEANGQWRNVSETGEIVSTLLQCKLCQKSLLEFAQIREGIVIAVEYLYLMYDRTECNWSNDINATVKAMHAIGLYDRINNFSANDFFFEISVKSARQTGLANLRNNTSSLQEVLDYVYKQELYIKQNAAFKNQLEQNLSQAKSQKAVLRILCFGAMAVALVLIFLMILIAIGLSNHPDILSELFVNWRSEFIYGFVGVVLGLIFMGIYSLIKKKVFNQENKQV